MSSTKSVVRSDNYIQISGWMVTELELKGNELLVYALIHGFCQDGKSVFNGGLSYVAAWTNLTKRAVINVIKDLLDKKLIVRREKIGSIPYEEPPYEYYTTKSRPDEEISAAPNENQKPFGKKKTPKENKMDGNRVPMQNDLPYENEQMETIISNKDILASYIHKLFEGRVDTNDSICSNLDRQLAEAGVPVEEYTEYIAWAYGYMVERCKTLENLPGYFHKSIQKPDLINKFKFYQTEKKQAEQKAREQEVTCLICGTTHNRNQRCLTCNNYNYDLKILPPKELYKRQKFFFLSPADKAAYNNELRLINNQYPSQVVLRNKQMRDEMNKAVNELDERFGLLYTEKENEQ